MPIDVVVPSNLTGLVWGPGLTYTAATDLIGPIPVDSNWVVNVTLDPEGGGLSWKFTKRTDGQRTVRLIPWVTDTPIVNTNFTPTAGQTVHIQTELQSSAGAVIESNRTDVVWDTTVALPTVMQSQAQGGFTTTDRGLLTAAERRSQVLGEPTDLVIQHPSGPINGTLAKLFSRNSIDRLTLTEITAGETCEPVRVNFSSFYFGVIVRVTTIAPDLTPKTPDQEWYFPDLAVLRIFRGADLEYRRGIHTPTFLTEKAWEWGWNILDQLDFLGVAPDNTIAVDWREGCCGQVFLMRWP